jgi:hypothetical protein
MHATIFLNISSHCVSLYISCNHWYEFFWDLYYRNRSLYKVFPCFFFWWLQIGCLWWGTTFVSFSVLIFWRESNLKLYPIIYQVHAPQCNSISASLICGWF